jgi:hypothetical protein
MPLQPHWTTQHLAKLYKVTGFLELKAPFSDRQVRDKLYTSIKSSILDEATVVEIWTCSTKDPQLRDYLVKKVVQFVEHNDGPDIDGRVNFSFENDAFRSATCPSPFDAYKDHRNDRRNDHLANVAHGQERAARIAEAKARREAEVEEEKERYEQEDKKWHFDSEVKDRRGVSNIARPY